MKVKDERVLFNAAKCRQCEDVIVSTHRHDFRYCKCGSIAVDGGLDYIKRSYKNYDDIIDMSIVEEYEREEYDWETKSRLQKEQNDIDLKLHLIRRAREAGSM